jgi:hypothetical protein
MSSCVAAFSVSVPVDLDTCWLLTFLARGKSIDLFHARYCPNVSGSYMKSSWQLLTFSDCYSHRLQGDKRQTEAAVSNIKGQHGI